MIYTIGVILYLLATGVSWLAFQISLDRGNRDIYRVTNMIVCALVIASGVCFWIGADGLLGMLGSFLLFGIVQAVMIAAALWLYFKKRKRHNMGEI